MTLKTVAVHTLNVGDKFVLESYSDKSNNVYVIYEMDARGWAECVEIHSGKPYSFGKDSPVVPVKLILSLRRLLFDKKPCDLTNKCGGCAHATTENKEFYQHNDTYVRCVCPGRKFARALAAYRPRTTKCCQSFTPKESEDAT